MSRDFSVQGGVGAVGGPTLGPVRLPIPSPESDGRRRPTRRRDGGRGRGRGSGTGTKTGDGGGWTPDLNWNDRHPRPTLFTEAPPSIDGRFRKRREISFVSLSFN